MTLTAQETLDQYIDRIGLTIDCRFKPWDGKGDACLKWDVTLRHHRDRVLACEYTAGIGHAPSWPAAVSRTECRTGYVYGSTCPVLPDMKDFVASICMDARSGLRLI